MAELRNSVTRYGLIARLFHGAMVLTIGANLALGLLFDDAIEPDEGGRFATLHATLGIATLLLLVGRIVWRFVDPPPPLTSGVPLERTMAHAGHFGLYALALAVTLSGWVVTSEMCGRVDLLGGLHLPSIATASDVSAGAPVTGDCAGESDEVWEEVHELGSWALLALIALHAGAALMHRRRKDGTWERMFG